MDMCKTTIVGYSCTYMYRYSVHIRMYMYMFADSSMEAGFGKEVQTHQSEQGIFLHLQSVSRSMS